MAFYTEKEIRNRLAVSTFIFRRKRPLDRETLGEIKKNDIGTIEIGFPEDPDHFALDDPKSMKIIKDTCNDLGLAVGTYHSGQTNFEVDSEAERRKRVDNCKRQIGTLLWMGGNIWGCHGRVKTPATWKSLEELLRHFEGEDVHLLVENFGPGQTIEDNIEFIDSIGHPQLGMIIDIGHVRNSEGQNPMTLSGVPTEKFHKVGSRLRHVHLHDFYDGIDHRAPFDGNMPWLEIFQALYDIDYKGFIHFEVAPPPRSVDALPKIKEVPKKIMELHAHQDG